MGWTYVFRKMGSGRKWRTFSNSTKRCPKTSTRNKDWSIYDEYKAAFDEITNLSIWEKIISWSPAGAITGISAKIKGVIEGGKLIDDIAQKAKATPAKETFEESSKRLAEESRQKDLEEMQWKAEYYQLIREGKFEEAQELLDSQSS